jgi:hypothetical protein
MVTSDNLDAITAGNHGYLVGLKRRRNKKLDKERAGNNFPISH